MLHTEPSFAIYSSDDTFEGEAENEDLIKEKMEKSAAVAEILESQFSFGSNSLLIIEEDDEDGEKEKDLNQFKDLGKSGPLNSDHDGYLDNYYSILVQENPSDPSALKDYAQYLESKGDFSGAEEYYYLATLADPKDGEILSEYATLVWKIHADETKASEYFERAVQVAPENSNVLAAYASFVWGIDENDEEASRSYTQADENSVMVDNSSEDIKEEKRPSSPPLHLAIGLGIDGHDFDYKSTRSDGSNDIEEYYRRMVEENPRNPSSLKNYARFLHQSKGDPGGAEEYYARAILADPNDGQMLCAYANILWQLHDDKDRAFEYFERAVIASPEDSDVLAAHAKILWETEGEDDDVEEDDTQA